MLAQKRKSFLSSIGRKPGSEECEAFRGAARRERSGESPAVRNAEHSEVRHGERKGESPAVRNAEHSEVRHGERKGESPAVRNAEHSEVRRAPRCGERRKQ